MDICLLKLKLKDQVIMPLIDIGATSNFLEVKNAESLGIFYKKELGWLKVVNSKTRSIFGVAQDGEVNLRERRG